MASVKRLRIHDQQEAMRLARAGLLRWVDPEFPDEGWGIYPSPAHLQEQWDYEYETWCPHILVEDEE